MNRYYNIECPICDNTSTVQVHYDDDEPRHCPMCGEDIEAIPTDDYDDD